VNDLCDGAGGCAGQYKCSRGDACKDITCDEVTTNGQCQTTPINEGGFCANSNGDDTDLCQRRCVSGSCLDYPRSLSLALLTTAQLIVSHLYVNLAAETVSISLSLITLLALMVILVQAVTCVKRVNASVNLLSAHLSRTNVDILSVS